jgi:hypothetical protein
MRHPCPFGAVPNRTTPFRSRWCARRQRPFQPAGAAQRFPAVVIAKPRSRRSLMCMSPRPRRRRAVHRGRGLGRPRTQTTRCRTAHSVTTVWLATGWVRRPRSYGTRARGCRSCHRGRPVAGPPRRERAPAALGVAEGGLRPSRWGAVGEAGPRHRSRGCCGGSSRLRCTQPAQQFDHDPREREVNESRAAGRRFAYAVFSWPAVSRLRKVSATPSHLDRWGLPLYGRRWLTVPACGNSPGPSHVGSTRRTPGRWASWAGSSATARGRGR